MKKGLRKLLAGTALGLASLLPMKGVEAQVTGSAGITLRDKYAVTPGFVVEEEPAVQSFVSLNKDGFYGLLWSNTNTKRGVTEADYVAGYGNSVRGIDFDASYNIFDLKNSGDSRVDDNLHELWLRFSKQGVVSPSLTLVQNLFAGDELEGGRRRNYAIFGLSHNRKINGIPVSLEGSLQFNNGYFSDNSGFSIAQANLSFPFDINGFSIAPQVRVRKTLDKKNFKDNADFGVSLSRSF